MSTLTDSLKVHEFGENLQRYDLNFENLIIRSRIKEFSKRVDDSGLTIKMGIKGIESYLIDNECFNVTPRHFLIVNKHRQFDCYLKSEEEVDAVCLYLSPSIVKEVFTHWTADTEQQLTNPFEWKKENPVFSEKLYAMTENELGLFLTNLRNQLLLSNGNVSFNFDGFYYTLAEKLMLSQIKINRQINNINSVKESTRKELYKRLTIARNYIFENYTSNLQLDDLSKIAFLSKYHLLRTYKQVFDITPYQEVLKLRLEKAKQMMHGDFSLEDIAFKLGFSDRRSFTKAFKKSEGVSPSIFRRKNLVLQQGL